MGSSVDRPVILCVDDSGVGLSLRKAILQRDGYSVFVARDAEAAIFICQCHPVSLIIADHMLKGESGDELAARMKATVPSVPIMMLSGTEPESLRNIDCFVHKGEPVPIMLAMVRDLVKRRKS